MNIQTPREKIDPSDLIQLAPFMREAEKAGLATKCQIQWWMRYRSENGLLSSGAIVEKKINPRSKRALLIVVRPRFYGWLAGQSEAA